MKIIKLIILIFTALILSCKGQEKKNNTMITNYTEAPKKLYYLNLELFLIYEIYINDVKITNHAFELGKVSGLEYLNEYILNSGKQTIKLINRDKVPSKTNLPNNIFKEFSLEVYSTDENEENISSVKKFDFPDKPTPRPYYFENTWEFDAEVPYNIDGWKKGKNLTKLNEEELKKQVVTKFEYFRNLLNKGKVDKFIQENALGYEEFVITNYYQKKWSEFDENIRELVEDQEGFMLPLENYKMKIYGNGKLVTLERIDTPFLGESALLAVDEKENTLYTDYISLYMPEGTDELKPIRLRVEYGLANFNK